MNKWMNVKNINNKNLIDKESDESELLREATMGYVKNSHNNNNNNSDEEFDFQGDSLEVNEISDQLRFGEIGLKV